MWPDNGYLLIIMSVIPKKILNLLFPKRCIGCRNSGSYLCHSCVSCIPYCEAISSKWIISVWSYKDPRIKKLIWRLKFENKFAIIPDLCRFATEHLMAELSDRAMFDNLRELILVPVPLSRKSKRARGYNQSEMIACEIACRLGPDLQVNDALIKTRETETQHSIKNRRVRLQNLRGAYSIKDTGIVEGKDVLLIDDITTTHATLMEARRALREAGAKKILAFTLAH